jgi:hypothetical protein
MSAHEYASGNGVRIQHFNGHQLRGYSLSDVQEQQDLLKGQCRKVLDDLLDRIGTEKYLTWCDERLENSDSLGEIMRKAEDYLSALNCPNCPFGNDPGMCGMCHEHGLNPTGEAR